MRFPNSVGRDTFKLFWAMLLLGERESEEKKEKREREKENKVLRVVADPIVEGIPPDKRFRSSNLFVNKRKEIEINKNKNKKSYKNL